MNAIHRLGQRLHRFVLCALDSPKFFIIVIGILVFQSLWIALSARFPQAFDENFHLGLIQLHAEQWLPYFVNHPPGAELYGAVTRDPSYFYHYIFSFPYRALQAVTDSLAIQIIVLRLMNIGLFVWGLFVARRLLQEIGASRRIMHVVLLFFVLTPIMPLLAAHINYDNLIFPLTGLLLLAVVRFLRILGDNQQVSVGQLLLFAGIGMLAAIVKYTVTPLLLAGVVVFVISLWHVYRRGIRPTWVIDIPRGVLGVVVAMSLVGLSFLFVERYGLNLIRYQSPQPDCAKVLTVEQCSAYSPWVRDHLYAASYPKPTTQGIAVYPFVWAHRMVFETMFVISSRFYPDGKRVEYWPWPPMTVGNYAAWTIVGIGGLLTAYWLKRFWKLTLLRVLLLMIAFYTIVLFIKNFSMYLHTGEAMAIHGRYLIPVYPVLYLVLALAFGWTLDRFRKPSYKVWLTLLTLVLFFQGSALVVWIQRSHPEWYWQQNSLVAEVNQTAKSVLRYTTAPDIQLWRGPWYPPQ
ncbi:MAG TPA: hypothetical protein VK983_00395 [Candidatus Limnocylindrales bacterium]|nr:hypothetical protein [Candidatus Limnocylindrales bacterium]